MVLCATGTWWTSCLVARCALFFVVPRRVAVLRDDIVFFWKSVLFSNPGRYKFSFNLYFFITKDIFYFRNISYRIFVPSSCVKELSYSTFSCSIWSNIFCKYPVNAEPFYWHTPTPEPVFVNLLGAPELIPSLAGRFDNPICHTGLPGWRNRFLGSLNVSKYGLRLVFNVHPILTSPFLP